MCKPLHYCMCRSDDIRIIIVIGTSSDAQQGYYYQVLQLKLLPTPSPSQSFCLLEEYKNCGGGALRTYEA